jgi:hypothetical protein
MSSCQIRKLAVCMAGEVNSRSGVCCCIQCFSTSRQFALSHVLSMVGVLPEPGMVCVCSVRNSLADLARPHPIHRLIGNITERIASTMRTNQDTPTGIKLYETSAVISCGVVSFLWRDLARRKAISAAKIARPGRDTTSKCVVPATHALRCAAV